ncbi:hypothetical protein Q2T83_10825 [Fervidibacter sacchari]|uniref:CheW-like domain-containing protein n=1 Tax=Candidatus Fervidibacter sacchari TaxID=1448929 RepID=A0ABT2EQG3_9BACT|nr:hypothetical protein [Candidatus Fervidibacter sacchari]MCS3920204.1 hypothetical protein [Candidatus Fervidibacter sacchari]WKU14828.1 hypothetical protein Q2T83_10825 [Candidatus Fervidibacter sacchari]
MEIRLGDLYELIVRIVDDRLKQRGEAEHIASLKGSESPLPEPQAKSPSEQQFQALQEQIAALIDLNRQILIAVRENQQRNEELLGELLNLLRQFLEASKVSDGRRTTLPSAEPSKPTREREEALKHSSDKQRSSEKTRKPSELSELAVMSPPDLSDEEIAFVPPDGWLNETSPQPVATDLAPDGIATPAVSAQPSLIEITVERLPEYLRRIFGIDVDYLSARQTPSPSLQGAQILVGEGTYNGQPVTLTVFGKPHITPTDITIFYNAVVRPLRGSVNEPVMSVIFGETFEQKAVKVAHALDLLVVNLKDLQEIGDEV